MLNRCTNLTYLSLLNNNCKCNLNILQFHKLKKKVRLSYLIDPLFYLHIILAIADLNW